VIPDPHAFTSDGPYFRALDAYARKVTQRLKNLEHHAEELANALNGYRESCGKEEMTLTAYKEFAATDWA
jgi:hypothetical protein